jgi:hypothetical protein
MIYSQYSFALVIIYTTFLYGLFMPILFIVCFIGLFNMQLVDNLALTYYYQKPPMYDGALNDKAYNILVMAPCSMFLFGYWAMSNAQMFLNIPPERAFTNRSPNPKHELIDLNHGLNQGLLALFIFAFWLFKIFWVSIGQPLIDCCFKKDEKDDEVHVNNEGLPSYWKALPGHLKMQWYTQELYDEKVSGVINLVKFQMKDL